MGKKKSLAKNVYLYSSILSEWTITLEISLIIYDIEALRLWGCLLKQRATYINTYKDLISRNIKIYKIQGSIINKQYDFGKLI